MMLNDRLLRTVVHLFGNYFSNQDLPSGAISAQAAALLAPPPKPPPDDDSDGVTGFEGFLLLPSEIQWTPFLIFFGCQVYYTFNNITSEVTSFQTGSEYRKCSPEVIAGSSGF